MFTVYFIDSTTVSVEADSSKFCHGYLILFNAPSDTEDFSQVDEKAGFALSQISYWERTDDVPITPVPEPAPVVPDVPVVTPDPGNTNLM
jgi:hypothetical protein